MNKILTTFTLLGALAYQSGEIVKINAQAPTPQFTQPVQQQPRLLDSSLSSSFKSLYSEFLSPRNNVSSQPSKNDMNRLPPIETPKLDPLDPPQMPEVPEAPQPPTPSYEIQQPTFTPSKETQEPLRPIPEPLPRDYDIHVAPLLDKPVHHPPRVIQVPVQRLDYSDQVHRFVSGLNCPSFPWVSANLVTERKLFRTVTRLDNVSVFNYQHQGGLDIVDSLEELSLLADRSSSAYRGATNPDAFERFARTNGLSHDFVSVVEGPYANTNQPTKYDVLATLGSLGKGPTVYNDCEGQRCIFGSLNDVMKLKNGK